MNLESLRALPKGELYSRFILFVSEIVLNQ